MIQGCQTAAEHRATLHWIERAEIVWLEPADAETALVNYARIHSANAIGVLDVLIAQTAISRQTPLYTFNAKHFAAYPGLALIQPYVKTPLK